MKTTDHLIGDLVSVRCRRSYRPGDTEVSWLSGRVIGRDTRPAPQGPVTRYVVQLDDHRRVVAFDDDLRRWTLSFEIIETLERMAS